MPAPIKYEGQSPPYALFLAIMLSVQDDLHGRGVLIKELPSKYTRRSRRTRDMIERVIHRQQARRFLSGPMFDYWVDWVIRVGDLPVTSAEMKSQLEKKIRAGSLLRS